MMVVKAHGSSHILQTHSYYGMLRNNSGLDSTEVLVIFTLILSRIYIFFLFSVNYVVATVHSFSHPLEHFSHIIIYYIPQQKLS